MKESARAAQHEIAHNRCVAALKSLVGEDDPKIRELVDLKARRMPPAVGAMMETQIMADILEGLAANTNGVASSDYPLSPMDQDVAEALVAAGYESLNEVRAASDEDLLDIKGIGPAKLKEIREAVG